MIIQEITLPRYDWMVRIYYAVDTYYADEILDDLIRMGCRGRSLVEASKNLWSAKLDTGLTYSNYKTHESLMVIGLARNKAQYTNSIAHEQGHLVKHIAETYGIDPNSEEVCYLQGDIAEAMYPYSHKLTCSHCS